MCVSHGFYFSSSSYVTKNIDFEIFSMQCLATFFFSDEPLDFSSAEATVHIVLQHHK